MRHRKPVTKNNGVRRFIIIQNERIRTLSRLYAMRDECLALLNRYRKAGV